MIKPILIHLLVSLFIPGIFTLIYNFHNFGYDFLNEFFFFSTGWIPLLFFIFFRYPSFPLYVVTLIIRSIILMTFVFLEIAYPQRKRLILAADILLVLVLCVMGNVLMFISGQ